MVLATKHVEDVSNSSAEEEMVALSPKDKVNVIFTPDVAVAFGLNSQDATKLKAERFKFEAPQCFSIGKLPKGNNFSKFPYIELPRNTKQINVIKSLKLILEIIPKTKLFLII